MFEYWGEAAPSRLPTPSMTLQRYIDPSAYNEKRLEEVAQERCGLCWNLWPASMMADDDGAYRRCPNCVGATQTIRNAQIEAETNEYAATRQTRPQLSRAPFRETIPWIRVMEDAGGNAVTAIHPLSIARGGATKTLILKGGGFASGDTITFSTGLSATKSLTGTVTWTLTVTAAVGASPGVNHMTFNNHPYRGIFSVS